jgi:uncharacterized protein YndB with AHSA1/START domain
MNTVYETKTSIEIEASPEVVWKALTDPKITKQYFLDCEAISSWKIGSSVVYKMIVEGKEVIPVKGIIITNDYPKLLEYTCFSPQDEGNPSKHTTVTYQLVQRENSTKLFVQQGKFSEKSRYQHTVENWEKVLGDLKKLVENQ